MLLSPCGRLVIRPLPFSLYSAHPAHCVLMPFVLSPHHPCRRCHCHLLPTTHPHPCHCHCQRERCCICSPLPQERLPSFHHHRHCSECCWRCACLKHPLLSHPLIIIIVGIVPATVCPPVLSPSPLLPLQRSLALCSLPGHVLSHPSVIIASAAIHVTIASSCSLHQRCSTPSLSFLVLFDCHCCLGESPPALFPLKLTFPAVSPPGASVSQQTDSVWPRPDLGTVCQVHHPPPSYSPIIFASPYPPVA